MDKGSDAETGGAMLHVHMVRERYVLRHARVHWRCIAVPPA